jgi:hypothetical protein
MLFVLCCVIREQLRERTMAEQLKPLHEALFDSVASNIEIADEARSLGGIIAVAETVAQSLIHVLEASHLARWDVAWLYEKLIKLVGDHPIWNEESKLKPLLRRLANQLLALSALGRDGKYFNDKTEKLLRDIKSASSTISGNSFETRDSVQYIDTVRRTAENQLSQLVGQLLAEVHRIAYTECTRHVDSLFAKELAGLGECQNIVENHSSFALSILERTIIALQDNAAHAADLPKVLIP